MRYTVAELRLLRALAGLLRRVDPVPAVVLADAAAAGMRVLRREPRLGVRTLDEAWLLPGTAPMA
jgi:hypothetical protein